MGADSFLGFRQWPGRRRFFVAPLIVASRPGQPLDGLKAALPEGLMLEQASHLDCESSGVEVESWKLSNQAETATPFYLLPGLHVM